MPKQIPVYLFVGQLESGKTKFIQETMEDPQFDSGDKTLLLICEEGEEEYAPARFGFGGVCVEYITDKADLTLENLQRLEKKSGCGRVVIEYNGMWLIQDLANVLPNHWVIYQCLATADGTTIEEEYVGDDRENLRMRIFKDEIRVSFRRDPFGTGNDDCCSFVGVFQISETRDTMNGFIRIFKKISDRYPL